ncbi:VQ motif-containing protein 25 [Sesamum alatum]|uniref:VQ motif-containing protein 25 n=1 Tax=Sesamum alatum TaxID=300844 RepID=A0AAE1YL11_9LAMI|nr:VQ motif-containing protein 25 [Sesamum alatum]
MKRLSAQKTAAAAAASPGAMHNDSHQSTILSKCRKPKIRIIHIFAPEIIKTDAANFREVVQTLTGKPITDDDDQRYNICSRKKRSRIFVSKRKVEVGVVRAGFGAASAACFREIRNTKLKRDQEQVWMGENCTGGSGFAEFDDDDEGFMQEIGRDHHHQFPFMAGTTDLMDVYEETQLA